MPKNIPFFPFRGKKLFIKDYRGNELYEGYIMKHPDEEELGVIRYEPNACQFRIQYDPQTHIPSAHIGLQMGERGQCFRVDSVYRSYRQVPWADKQQLGEK